MNDKTARAVAAAQYALADEKLRDDPEWQRLCADADREAVETPEWWVARNLKALHREMATPMFPKESTA